MKITEKKVITVVRVEIEFQEFFDGLVNLIDDVQADRYFEDNVSTRELIKNKNSKEITIEEARDSFVSSFGLLHDATLRYLAKQSGYNVQNYGIYDRFIKCIICSFSRDGEHI